MFKRTQLFGVDLVLVGGLLQLGSILQNRFGQKLQKSLIWSILILELRPYIQGFKVP
jgi:hypothetical protein